MTLTFDKDEIEIMELYRSGETRTSDKTFWVLNRWDSLSAQQQRQTVADFEAKMLEFAIPMGFASFRTNALHGLLSQLGMRNEAPLDLSLQSHLKDYDDDLAAKYGGSHATAFRESQVPAIQEQVLGFLNNRLRKTTLCSAYDNVQSNFCEPLPHHLRRAKEADDVLITGELSHEEKEVLRQRADQQSDQRAGEISRQIQELCNDVAVKRNVILRERTRDLEDQLRAKLHDGPETDAYKIYQEIIATRELRKYPYHFEIEMKVVDNLNMMLKQNFRQIVGTQVDEVFDDLVRKVQNALEKVREDVAYNAQVMAPFDEIIREQGKAFRNRVDGVVMTLAAQLDELLLYKPKGFLGFFGGNEMLEGLEEAARMGFDSLRNPGQAIQESDFQEKTKKIRQTLTDHYINKVREYHEQITHDVFPIVINNMQQIEKELMKAMQSKYRPALDVVLGQEIGNEFAAKRKGLEERSRRFRGLIEQIQDTQKSMSEVLAGVAEGAVAVNA